MIDFVDGTKITYTQAAALVRDEGRLGTQFYVDADGLRCLLGVLEQRSRDSRHYLRLLTEGSCQRLVCGQLSAVHNDAYEGTPEERCEEMARRLEALAEKEEAS